MSVPRELYGIASDTVKATKLADANPNRKLLIVQVIAGSGNYDATINFDGSADGFWIRGLYSWVKFETENDSMTGPVYLAPMAVAVTVNVIEVSE